MAFTITIHYYRRDIRLSVEQVELDGRMERYHVQARNGTIIVESNRPLFRNRGLKHRAPTWKVIGGNALSSDVLKKIYEAIQNHVEKGNASA